MARKPSPDNPPCPRCGATHVDPERQQGWAAPLGVPELPALVWAYPGHGDGSLARPPTEVRVGMRRGGRSAAEEITGHKDETIPGGGRRPEVLVHDLHWSEVEVDAFGSFVQKSLRMLEIRPPRRAGWARVGDVGVRTGRLVLGWRGALGLRRMRSRRRGWRRPVNARRVGGA
jgi:hypothetical protein